MKSLLLIICLGAISPLLFGQERQLMASLTTTEGTNLSLEAPNTTNRNALKSFVKNYLTYSPDRYIYVGCNEQNQYYENDTVRMRKISHDYYPVWQCCEFVEWNLIDDARFLWSDLQACKEGVQRSYYLSTTKVEASLKSKDIYLDVSRNGSTIERFRLIRIEKANSKNNAQPDPVLVLLRVTAGGQD